MFPRNNMDFPKKNLCRRWYIGPLMSLLLRDRRYKMQTSWTTQNLLESPGEKWDENVA